MEHLRFDGIAKRFENGAQALERVDLAVQQGELISLVGPSGSGKSTLLNVLAGFERPSAGHVWIDGVIVDELPPSARQLSMVFQSYALYPHLTVSGNIAFPLQIAKTPRAEQAARVQEMAERLGLGPFLDRRPAQLSGGQRQRVALARALVRKPRLCLLDEPLSNLDPTLRSDMRAEIKKLHEELGTTFVYVTHDQAEAMTLSDRIVVLRDGRVEQVGPPAAIYDEPANAFVAGFLGSPRMNLLTAELLPPTLRPQECSQVGIRPEHVLVTTAPAEGSLLGNVWLVEPLGAETWITVELQLGARVTGRASAGAAPRTGDVVHARLDRARLHAFDHRGQRQPR